VSALCDVYLDIVLTGFFRGGNFHTLALKPPGSLFKRRSHLGQKHWRASEEGTAETAGTDMRDKTKQQFHYNEKKYCFLLAHESLES